jgi:lipoprotein-releasing system ATP-binding protein
MPTRWPSGGVHEGRAALQCCPSIRVVRVYPLWRGGGQDDASNVTAGTVEIAGHDFGKMPPEELYRFRNQEMGFVFQFHYLLAELTAIENVLMPTLKLKRQEERRPHAEMLLKQFGLAEKHNRLPRQLSGGEQQRLAIARALVMEPKYLFADEPTGALDTANGEIVMQIIRDVNLQHGTTIVLVTHDPDFAAEAQRQIRLVDGRLAGDEAVAPSS